MRVSHETIYRSLFIQARGVLKKELLGTCDPSAAYAGRSTLVSLKTRAVKSPRPSPSGKDPLRWRTAPFLVIGRGDLLRGSRNSHIATLVERHSRFTALVKVSSRDTAVVIAALTRHVRKLPKALRRSLTWDRGLEMAKHKSFTVATDVKVYFCDPQSPWQRGSNEKHKRAITTILPEENRPVRLFPVGSGQSSAALKSNAHERL